MIDENSLQQIRGIQSDEEARTKAEKLPEYVKCMYCGGRPKWGDLLGEVIQNSTALAHESCMAARGKIFGLNAGAEMLVEKPSTPLTQGEPA
jgi:hypothetical protein